MLVENQGVSYRSRLTQLLKELENVSESEIGNAANHVVGREVPRYAYVLD